MYHITFFYNIIEIFKINLTYYVTFMMFYCNFIDTLKPLISKNSYFLLIVIFLLLKVSKVFNVTVCTIFRTFSIV